MFTDRFSMIRHVQTCFGKTGMNHRNIISTSLPKCPPGLAGTIAKCIENKRSIEKDNSKLGHPLHLCFSKEKLPKSKVVFSSTSPTSLPFFYFSSLPSKTSSQVASFTHLRSFVHLLSYLHLYLKLARWSCCAQIILRLQNHCDGTHSKLSKCQPSVGNLFLYIHPGWCFW